jgi:hypothetical protein
MDHTSVPSEVGLILKTLDLLGLRTSPSEESQPSPTKDHRQSEPSRLDEVFRRLQQPGPWPGTRVASLAMVSAAAGSMRCTDARKAH